MHGLRVLGRAMSSRRLKVGGAKMHKEISGRNSSNLGATGEETSLEGNSGRGF